MAIAARKEPTRRRGEAKIAIVDAGGTLRYLERPDRQSPNSVNVAALKARTAAFRERPSALQQLGSGGAGWLMFPILSR